MTKEFSNWTDYDHWLIADYGMMVISGKERMATNYDKYFINKIEEIDAFLFSLHKPKSFNGKTSIEIKYDKQFETACMIISQKSNMNAKKMTVLEFYSTLNNLSKQAEAEAKAYKKVRR